MLFSVEALVKITTAVNKFVQSAMSNGQLGSFDSYLWIYLRWQGKNEMRFMAGECGRPCGFDSSGSPTAHRSSSGQPTLAIIAADNGTRMHLTNWIYIPTWPRVFLLPWPNTQSVGKSF